MKQVIITLKKKDGTDLTMEEYWDAIELANEGMVGYPYGKFKKMSRETELGVEWTIMVLD